MVAVTSLIIGALIGATRHLSAVAFVISQQKGERCNLCRFWNKMWRVVGLKQEPVGYDMVNRLPDSLVLVAAFNRFK